MGTYKRLPRERPKPANEFATWLDKAYRWIELNWRAVLTGIGSVAVITALILIISHYAGSRDEKARELFYKATKVAQGSDEAVAALEKVINDYPRTGIAQVARLKLGDIWYARGNYDKAEEVLTPLAKAGNPIIRVLGLDNIAANKLAKDDAKGAAEIYLKAYSDTKNPTRGLSYFNAALAYQKAGELEEARKIFEELSKEETDYSTPDLREKSKEQLIWMATRLTEK